MSIHDPIDLIVYENRIDPLFPPVQILDEPELPTRGIFFALVLSTIGFTLAAIVYVLYHLT